jgi:hypothetical protein
MYADEDGNGWYSWSEVWKVTICTDCGVELSIGDWPFCPHGSLRSSDAERFIPPVVFRNPSAGDQEFMVPGRSDQQPPPGYERVELKTRAQIDRFCKEYDSHQKDVKDRIAEMEDRRGASNSNARNISRLERAIPQIPSELLVGPKGRKVSLRKLLTERLEAAKARSRSADAARFSPNAFFSAFEMDQGNRPRCDDRDDIRERARR